jgi:hypothetical protein
MGDALLSVAMKSHSSLLFLSGVGAAFCAVASVAAGCSSGSSTTGSGGSGGGAGAGSGGAGGAIAGSGGSSTCLPNQVWCPGCTPGTGACYVGGCPGIACPPLDSGSPDDAATGTGGAGGRADAGGGTGGVDGGSNACGSRACSSTEVCVHPGCGGGVPICDPVPDGGQCPTGWTFQSSCPRPGGPGPGCQPPPCTPPAPFCITVPAACSGAPTCSCLPADICTQTGGTGQCATVTNGEVVCLSA